MRRKTVLRQLVSRWGNFSPQVQNVIMQEEPIDADSFDLPDAPEVRAGPVIRTNSAATVSILQGEGNPEPITEETWSAWEALKARAAAVQRVQRATGAEP